MYPRLELKVDQEQRISRRSSVSPHRVALAAAVDQEQEVFTQKHVLGDMLV